MMTLSFVSSPPFPPATRPEPTDWTPRAQGRRSTQQVIAGALLIPEPTIKENPASDYLDHVANAWRV